MKIGIDVSQMAYEQTGVALYVKNLVEQLVQSDKNNEYILFFSHMRKKIQKSNFKIQSNNAKLKIKTFFFPPSFLDLLWNRLHIFPIEWFIGDIDIFISSDWTQPPTTKAKKVTILYDLVVYKFPQETDTIIINTQKRRLHWVKKECDAIICISESTKKDAMEILGIEEKRLHIAYPGV